MAGPNLWLLRFERPPGVTMAGLRRQMPAVFGRAAGYWHEKFAPLHFEPSAMGRYRYAARSPRWNKRKRMRRARQISGRSGSGAQFGYLATHLPVAPLVWTGALRAAVVGRKAYPIASATGVRLPMKVPWYATRRFTARKRIPMTDEVLRVTALELAELEELAVKHTKEWFGTFRATKVVQG